MDNQNNGSVSVTVVTKEENPSFLNEKVKLDKLLKDLTKASREALAVLEKGLDSPDERIRIQCADKILTYLIATAKEVNNDQMQRLIAEIKLNRQPASKLISLTPAEEEEQRKNKPIVDFTTIRQV